MPLPALLTLPTPAPLADVRLADVDGDGVDEVVMAARLKPTGPSGLALVVADGDADGRFSATRHDLPAKALWWDAGHGLWVVDGKGLRTIEGRRLIEGATGLPGGPGTPTRAGLVTDLDQDGRAELVVRLGDRVEVVGEDGARWGGLSAPPEARLEARAEAGGQALVTTLTAPPVAVADVDGDGVLDLVVTGAEALSVVRVTPGALAATPSRWPLPPALREVDDDVVTDARWQDMDGDGRADLLVNRVRSDGALEGTESELHLHLNTGGGLGPARVLPTGAGSDEAYPADVDGDGDMDVLVPQVDLDVGNLARALVTRAVEVTLVLVPFDGGRLAPPVPLRAITLHLDGDKAAWAMFDDLDGDRLPDLVVAMEGRLRCYRGRGRAVDTQPWVDLALSGPVEHVLSRDLTGDGAPELVLWAPGATAVQVVRLR